jgi:hypothetical protein
MAVVAKVIFLVLGMWSLLKICWLEKWFHESFIAQGLGQPISQDSGG